MIAADASVLLAALSGRAGLAELASDARAAMARQNDPAALALWEDAVVALLNANAGIACVGAMLRLRGPAAVLADVARQARLVCLDAGGPAATSCLEAWDRLRVTGVWPGLVRLAREAAACLPAAVAHAPAVIEAVGGEGFAGFVAFGLKATERDKRQRAAFFALTSPLARQALARGHGAGLSAYERRLKLFGAALWGRIPGLRPMPQAEGRPIPRRASVSDGVVLLPEVFPGVPQAGQERLYRAAVAHAVAHLMNGATRRTVGSLKPLQLVLVGLIEDARVEALALRRFPGLRRLWAPYHVAQAEGNTVPALLARLARALFDPAYEDAHGWVVKGRALVDAADPFDTEASRRIGGLLGNDLGQMRLQFNARTYVIEPAYRDDGLGFWNFGEQADAPPEILEMMVEAARLRQEAGEGRQDRAAAEPGTARARPVAASAEKEGALLARYPEWDRAQGIERPDWTSVHDMPPALGDVRTLTGALDAVPDLRRRIDRLVRAARPGRPRRLKRQPDGLELDIDAVLDTEISRLAGEMPTDRVYRSSTLQERDLATVVLVDVSESTRAGGVLEAERLAVALLGDAMARLGDPFALMAFASSGREHVRLTRIKDFAEPFGVTAHARLAGLSPGLSTRLGAALRHSGAVLDQVRSFRRLIIVLTDGEPSDIDVPDAGDLVEDARRAALGLRARGIDTFAVVLGTAAPERIFGRSGYATLRRIEDLPARLSDLYFRLSRR